MAQIYLPEHNREREQLQQSVNAPDLSQRRKNEERPPRRIGLMDLVIILVIASVISLLVIAPSRWAAPLTPAVLPVYAGYSLLRSSLPLRMDILLPRIVVLEWYWSLCSTFSKAFRFSHFCRRSCWHEWRPT